jgi:hypothetical protein
LHWNRCWLSAAVVRKQLLLPHHVFMPIAHGALVYSLQDAVTTNDAGGDNRGQPCNGNATRCC